MVAGTADADAGADVATGALVAVVVVVFPESLQAAVPSSAAVSAAAKSSRFVTSYSSV
ncbi:hypothetical protein ACFQX7_12940 [Luedemannella flava]